MAGKSNIFTRILQLVLDKTSIEKTKRDTQAALKAATDPKNAEQNLNRVERGFLKLKLAAVALTAALFTGLAFALRKVTNELIASQKAMAQQEAVLKSTGMAAGRTAQQLDKQAAALSRVTTFQDDAITSAQNLLLTFRNIKGTEFDETIKQVLNVATALGTDASTAALQLGKALQDPITGLTALRRSGISFSEAKKDVIKNLVETGRLAEAQRLILKELEIQFGGSAEAARNTLGGALTGLKNAWDDLFEVDRESTSGLIKLINYVAGQLPLVLNFLDTWLDRGARALELAREFHRLAMSVSPEGVLLGATGAGEVVSSGAGRSWDPAPIIAVTEAVEGFTEAIVDTGEAVEDLQRKRLDTLLAGLSMGLLDPTETQELAALHASLNQQLHAGNVALEERVRLARMLKEIGDTVVARGRPVGQRSAADALALGRPTLAGMPDPTAGAVTAQEDVPTAVADSWTEAFDTIATEGEAAALIIAEVLSGTGEGFTELLKRLAPAKAAENFARALEALGAGLARFVLYHDPTAIAAGAKAAALHTAAGVAWSALGGGGGKGGASGGIGGAGGAFGAREPAGRGADRFQPLQTIIVQNFVDGVDPKNGVHQEKIGNAFIRFEERQGSRNTNPRRGAG